MDHPQACTMCKRVAEEKIKWERDLERRYHGTLPKMKKDVVVN